MIALQYVAHSKVETLTSANKALDDFNQYLFDQKLYTTSWENKSIKSPLIH